MELHFMLAKDMMLEAKLEINSVWDTNSLKKQYKKELILAKKIKRIIQNVPIKTISNRCYRIN